MLLYDTEASQLLNFVTLLFVICQLLTWLISVLLTLDSAQEVINEWIFSLPLHLFFLSVLYRLLYLLLLCFTGLVPNI